MTSRHVEDRPPVGEEPATPAPLRDLTDPATSAFTEWWSAHSVELEAEDDGWLCEAFVAGHRVASAEIDRLLGTMEKARLYFRLYDNDPDENGERLFAEPVGDDYWEAVEAAEVSLRADLAFDNPQDREPSDG